MAASKRRKGKKRKLPDFYYERRLWKEGFKYIAGIDEVGRGSFAGPVVAGCVAFPKQLSMNRFIDSVYSNAGNKKLHTSDTFGTFGTFPKIDDSKKLTERQRVVADEWIRKNAVTWGIGEASVGEINRLGIVRATSSAFRRAVAHANIRAHARVEYLLIDAFYIPYISGYPVGRKRSKRRPRTTLTSSRGLRLRIGRASLRGRQLAIVNGDSKSFSIAAASIVAKVYRDNLMKRLGTRKNYVKYDWINSKGYGTKTHREAILKHGITKHHRRQFVETFLKGDQD